MWILGPLKDQGGTKEAERDSGLDCPVGVLWNRKGAAGRHAAEAKAQRWDCMGPGREEYRGLEWP